jgi:hypothetical protein
MFRGSSHDGNKNGSATVGGETAEIQVPDRAETLLSLMRNQQKRCIPSFQPLFFASL